MANITVTASNPVVNVSSTNNTVNVSQTTSTVNVSLATGLSQSAIRGYFGNTFPILYDSSTGIYSIDEDAIVDETVVSNGILSGNITLDLNAGRMHKVTLNGDVTGITLANVVSGRSATVIFSQDATGSHALDTTTFPSNWTTWEFANQNTDLDENGTNFTVMSVFYDGSNYYASLVPESAQQISTSDIANLAITTDKLAANAVTSAKIDFTSFDTDSISVGSTNLYFTNALARASVSASGDLSYNSTTGVFSFTNDAGDIESVTAGSGLTGGGTTGNVTLDVGAGNGITVNADNVAVDMSVFTTSDLTEGTNQYFTTDRANTAIGNYTGALTNLTGNITTTGVLSAGNSADQTHNLTGNLNVTGNVEVSGNLNYRNVEDLYVQDQSITLNANAATDATSSIIINRPVAGSNTVIRWNETSDIWEFSNDGSTYYPIPTSTTDLAEGTNLYYTNARVDAHLSGGYGITYTGGVIETTNADVRALISATGNINYDAANGIISESLTTTDITEGDNLYYTTDRANTAIATKLLDSGRKDAFNLRVQDLSVSSNAELGTLSYYFPNTSPGSAGQFLLSSDATNLGFSDFTDEANTAIGAYTGSMTNLTGNVTTTANINAAGGTLTGVLTSDSNILLTDAFFEGDLNGAVTIDVNNNTGVTLTKGQAVYLTGGNSGDNPNVALADADDVTKMPALGIVRENIGIGAIGQVVTSGVMNFSSHGFTAGADLFISTTAGDLTETAPTGESAGIQKIGKVVSSNHIIVQGAFRTNATPNLDDGAIFAGNSTNQAVAVDTTTNFSVSDTTFDLSNTLSNVNSISATYLSNLALSTSGVVQYPMSSSTNYYPPSVLGTETIIMASDLPQSDFANGTLITISGITGGAANLNGSYYIQYYGSSQAYLLWEDANLSVASNSNIGGIQSISPVGYVDNGATSFGNVTIDPLGDVTVGKPLNVTSTGTFSNKVTVGGDGSGVGEVNIKEYANATGGAGFNFFRGRGTEASPTELNQGDFIMSFQSQGVRNRYDQSLKNLRLSTIQSIQVDNPNTFKTVPSVYAFGGQRETSKVFDTSTYSLTNDFQNYGFRLGATEQNSSKTYLQNSVVATPDKAFAPKGLVVGNETALQEGLTEANLSIGHTDVETTIPVAFNYAYQANSGIQYYSFGAQFYNFLTRGTGNLDGDQVCIELFSNLKPESDFNAQGYQEGWIADGSKITVPDFDTVTVNAPTGPLANIGNSTITGASNNEFYVKGVSNFGRGRIYAFFTDSAMSNALTYSALGGGTPGVDGTQYGGWGNVTYKTGDYSMLMSSSNVTTSASGANADFIVSKSGSTYTVGSNFDISPATQRGDVFGYNMLVGGDGFVVGETVTISGEHLGGVAGTNNLTFTVDSVDGSGAVTSIGNVAGTGHDVTNEMWSIKKSVTSAELEITNNNTDTATRRMNLGSNVVLNLASHSNTEILAFTGNTAGDVVYNSTDNRVAYYNGSTWQNLDAGTTIT